MKIATVKFNVGVAHPLFDKEVQAEIISENTGYDGKRTYAKTIDEVFHASNPEGILVFKGDKLIGHKESLSRSEIHEGYATIIR